MNKNIIFYSVQNHMFGGKRRMSRKSRRNKHTSSKRVSSDAPLLPQDYNKVTNKITEEVIRGTGEEEYIVQEEKNTIQYKCGPKIGLCDAGKYCNNDMICVDEESKNSRFDRFRFCKNNENHMDNCKTRILCSPDEENNKPSCRYIANGKLKITDNVLKIDSFGKIKLEKHNMVEEEGETKYKCGKDIGICDPNRYCNKDGYCVDNKNVITDDNLNSRLRMCTKDELKDCKNKGYCPANKCISKIVCGDYNGAYGCNLVRKIENI